MWAINTIVDNIGWYELGVTNIGGDTGIIFSNTDDVIVCFAKNW